MNDSFIDIRRSKAAARRLFPPGHVGREMLLSEPDFMPSEEGCIKIDFYVMLFKSLKDREKGL